MSVYLVGHFCRLYIIGWHLSFPLSIQSLLSFLGSSFVFASSRMNKSVLLHFRFVQRPIFVLRSSRQCNVWFCFSPSIVSYYTLTPYICIFLVFSFLFWSFFVLCNRYTGSGGRGESPSSCVHGIQSTGVPLFLRRFSCLLYLE